MVFGASDYCFPGAEVQARQGLGQEHLMDLFLTLSQAWFKEKLVTQESYQDLQVLAVDGVIWLMPHPRTRERFLALYEVATGSTATQVSRHT